MCKRIKDNLIKYTTFAIFAQTTELCARTLFHTVVQNVNDRSVERQV
jgi:hypothetical protein